MSNTNLEKLQTTQNTALRIITGCTSDTNIQHLHNETETLPLPLHLKLHASQLWHKSQLVTHPLHELNHQQIPPRSKKQTIFTDNCYHSLQAYTTPATNDTIKANLKHTHHQLVQLHLTSRKDNPIIAQKPPTINKSEETLPRKTRRTLAQVRIDKSPILLSYLNKINPQSHPSSLCPLCRTHNHDTPHLFSCTQLNTKPQYPGSLARSCGSCRAASTVGGCSGGSRRRLGGSVRGLN